MNPLLEAHGLRKTYRRPSRIARMLGQAPGAAALDDVSLSVAAGETLGLVGESGCGKSTLGRTLLRLDEPDAGEVLFEGRPITGLSRSALRRLRPRMQMVFQDSYAALNPRRRVGSLLAEPMRVHRRADGTRWTAAGINARLEELMGLVGLSPAHLGRYPHEFSGGQRQRVNIARALALQPSLIVADEPVSALDVSIQAQVLNLFMDLRERFGLTYVFISHDLGVVRQIGTRVAVMYAGRIVEQGAPDAVLHHSAHHYTRRLVAAALEAGPGPVPVAAGGSPHRDAPVGRGCCFYAACPAARARCAAERPALGPVSDAASAYPHDVACHFPA